MPSGKGTYGKKVGRPKKKAAAKGKKATSAKKKTNSNPMAYPTPNTPKPKRKKAPSHGKPINPKGVIGTHKSNTKRKPSTTKENNLLLRKFTNPASRKRK